MNDAISENVICCSLYLSYRSASSVTAPRYTPPKWWECDFFRITKAGFFYEYEIKQTREDFKADFKKAKTEWGEWDAEQQNFDHTRHNKHNLLEAGSDRGPSYFNFVVPEKLTNNIVIPDYAGLITFTPSTNRKRVYLTVQKKAPQLHKNKIKDPQHVYRQACERLAYRYWNLLIGGLAR